jgi:hypothetical protein
VLTKSKLERKTKEMINFMLVIATNSHLMKLLFQIENLIFQLHFLPFSIYSSVCLSARFHLANEDEDLIDLCVVCCSEIKN